MRPTVATPDDLAGLAQLYAEAFVDDPMIRWPLPSDVGLSDVSVQFGELVRPYIPLGVVWQVDDQAGSAVWLDPATTARFAEIDHGMRASIAHLTDDGGERYAVLWDWVESHLPKEPCWFLDMIAVRESRRGTGLGRMLVDHGLALARAEGLPAFLETGRPENVELYERMGFSVVHEGLVPLGGPRVWFMRAG